MECPRRHSRGRRINVSKTWTGLHDAEEGEPRKRENDTCSGHEINLQLMTRLTAEIIKDGMDPQFMANLSRMGQVAVPEPAVQIVSAELPSILRYYELQLC